MRRLVISFFTCALLAFSSAVETRAQVVIVPSAVHEYTFNIDLSDSAGGAALQSFGGTVTGGSYVFGANQGLLLENPLVGTSTYTLEAMFLFDATGGYQRIFDVKDRTADTGLYALGQSLNFYNVASSSTADFVAGQPVHVVLTRDGLSQQVTAYVNGQQRFTFTDTGSLGEISGVNKQLHFFIDDLAVANEAATGSVDFLRVFDQSLNAAQVMELYQNGAPLAVPEPSTWALMITGLIVIGVTLYRRK
ncbi:LamG-like jellyroll fold domain-containing protein [Oleiharenicola lentus]|uniref:LamG-like jellyroll fold domain-containing protein n=1 Tax=Oleiharenicola lentus TaxID=2508720 RepID=UPI003F66D1B2